VVVVVVVVVDDVESVAGAAVLSVALSVAGAIELSVELSVAAAGSSVVAVDWPQAATPKARTAAAAAAKPIWIFVIGNYPSSQRRGLPPTREPFACQGLTLLASAARA
jgi:hypothetical protein